MISKFILTATVILSVPAAVWAQKPAEPAKPCSTEASSSGAARMKLKECLDPWMLADKAEPKDDCGNTLKAFVKASKEFRKCVAGLPPAPKK
ncbi:MAG TPA: hypothetical protein VFV50_04170 [Bdellovibrionales bacterium]|nr:hypothetical protein [Bdellovibrionales bacterium]